MRKVSKYWLKNTPWVILQAWEPVKDNSDHNITTLDPSGQMWGRIDTRHDADLRSFEANAALAAWEFTTEEVDFFWNHGGERIDITGIGQTQLEFRTPFYAKLFAELSGNCLKENYEND